MRAALMKSWAAAGLKNILFRCSGLHFEFHWVERRANVLGPARPAKFLGADSSVSTISAYP